MEGGADVCLIYSFELVAIQQLCVVARRICIALLLYPDLGLALPHRHLLFADEPVQLSDFLLGSYVNPKLNPYQTFTR